ncbi:MAG: reverse transcriptase-like protein [Firmicutes bacterium]|nr:reverse transcriptase-like protein [Bacillota bacterium]
MHVLAFSDGSFQAGTGAIGVVLFTPKMQRLRSFGAVIPEPVHSANEAEYLAVLRALQECLRIGATEVTLYTDSELLHRQVLGIYSVTAEHLRELHAQVTDLSLRFRVVHVEHIRSEHNPAHALAKTALNRHRKRTATPALEAVDIDSNAEHTTQAKEVHSMKITVTEHTLLEPDAYRVKLVDVEEVQGQFGKQIRFQMETTDPDLPAVPLTAWANSSTSVTSKAVKWAGAFNGAPFRQGDTIDFDALIGKEAKAVVEVKQSGDGREFNRVTDILPLRRRTLSTEEMNRRAREERQREQLEDDPFLSED